ncbi:MAG: translation initiation factor, partial [Proteobacteria bacterium]
PMKSARPSADGKLVYSTDPSLNTKCERCKKLTSDCACPAQETVHDRKIVARLRIEKNGRGGKTVTVIDELPSNDEFLQEWVTRLKKKCGSGGSQHRDERGGVIEIQGDHRETIRKIFQEAGFKTKGH